MGWTEGVLGPRGREVEIFSRITTPKSSDASGEGEAVTGR